MSVELSSLVNQTSNTLPRQLYLPGLKLRAIRRWRTAVGRCDRSLQHADSTTLVVPQWCLFAGSPVTRALRREGARIKILCSGVVRACRRTRRDNRAPGDSYDPVPSPGRPPRSEDPPEAPVLARSVGFAARSFRPRDDCFTHLSGRTKRAL